jgi:hypothetical protein
LANGFSTIWNGYGEVKQKGDTWLLSPKVATAVNETHSCLVLSDEIEKTGKFTIEAKTIAQLRQNDPPNVWEVAWVVFSAKDQSYFWYTLLKKNGLEIGYFTEGQQHFVLTKDTPKLIISYPHVFKFNLLFSRLELRIDNNPRVIIPRRITKGRLGYYCEDSICEYQLLQ